MRETDQPSSDPRRRLLLGAVGAAGVGAVSATVAGTPAHAAAGDPVITGHVNHAGQAGTSLTSTASGPTLLLGGASSRKQLLLRPTPAAARPAQAPSGSMVTTEQGDLGVASADGTVRWVYSQRWATTTVPIRPKRLLDTRWALGALPSKLIGGQQSIDRNGMVRAGSTLYLSLEENWTQRGGSVAHVLNLTVADTAYGGYVTVWPAGQPWPGTSSINYWGAGQALSVLVEAALGSHPVRDTVADDVVAIYVHSPAVIIVDVCGVVTRNPAIVPRNR